MTNTFGNSLTISENATVRVLLDNTVQEPAGSTCSSLMCYCTGWVQTANAICYVLCI